MIVTMLLPTPMPMMSNAETLGVFCAVMFYKSELPRAGLSKKMTRAIGI